MTVRSLASVSMKCLPLFAVWTTLFIILRAMQAAPVKLDLIVDEENKPFALGVEWVFIRLLGTIPGPILVGWVIDQTCLIFLDGSCGNKGNCLLYSHDKMAVGIMIWWLVVSLMSAGFYLIAIAFQAQMGSSTKSFDLTTKK